jgi:hypothetical protein
VKVLTARGAGGILGQEMSRMMNQAARIAARIAAVIAALAVPALTYAQNCSLCYTQAASAGSRMIAALKSGILILVAPPMLICLGIAWMAYKKRNQFNES